MSNPRPIQESYYVELISVLFIMGVLVGVLWPGYSNVLETQQRQEHLEGCRNNLTTLSESLEVYARSHKGTYPATLAELTAGKKPLLEKLPPCPTLGKVTYEARGGYKVKNSPPFSRFTLTCVGNNHVDSGLLKDQPYYDSMYGKVQPLTTVDSKSSQP